MEDSSSDITPTELESDAETVHLEIDAATDPRFQWWYPPLWQWAEDDYMAALPLMSRPDGTGDEHRC